jgi:hypothetical protein
MRDFLTKLGIEQTNSGGCTGLEWLHGKGGEIESIRDRQTGRRG